MKSAALQSKLHLCGLLSKPRTKKREDDEKKKRGEKGVNHRLRDAVRAS
jgi:hypothetical protein